MADPLNLADAPDVLTVDEVIRVLRIGRDQAYNLVHAGLGRKVGRRWIVPKHRVARYIEELASEAS